MIVTIEMKIIDNDNRESLLFKGNDVELEKLDRINGFNINRLNWFSVYREIKRKSSMEDKENIVEVISNVYNKKKSNQLKGANLCFIGKENNKAIVDINLMEAKNIEELYGIFNIKNMTNGGYIIYANLFISLITAFFMSATFNILGNIEHLFISTSTFVVFLYTSIIPILAALNLLKTKKITGTSYFDGYFISKYITFPIIYIFTLFNIGFALEFVCQYHKASLPTVYPFEIMSFVYISAFCIASFFISLEVFKRFKRFQDKFIL